MSQEENIITHLTKKKLVGIETEAGCIKIINLLRTELTSVVKFWLNCTVS